MNAQTTKGTLEGYACLVSMGGCLPKQGILIAAQVETKGFIDNAFSEKDGRFLVKEVPIGEPVSLAARIEEVVGGRRVVYFGTASGVVRGPDQKWPARPKPIKMGGTTVPPPSASTRQAVQLRLLRVSTAPSGANRNLGYKAALWQGSTGSSRTANDNMTLWLVVTSGAMAVPNASISVVEAASGKVAGGFSGPDGAFRINLRAHTDYILMVSEADHEPANFLLAGDANGFRVAAPGGGWSAARGIELKRRSRLVPGSQYAQGGIETIEGAKQYFFTDRLIQTLPLEGMRSVDRLALLSPGVYPPPETFGRSGPGLSAGLGTAGQFSVNGLRSRENNFTVDASDNNDEDVGVRRQGFLAPFPQSVESLTAFQIITALPDARYGRAIGGQVNAVSQVGGSRFHGTLYGFLTDSRLKARDFFNPRRRGLAGKTGALVPITANGAIDGPPVAFDLGLAGSSPIQVVDGKGFQISPPGHQDPCTRVQAGLAFGGPIARSGSFLFASFERQATRASRESHFAVPTVRQRGIFESGDTGLFATTSLGQQIQGLPLLPATLPGNAVLSLFPFPNDPEGPYGANTFTSRLPTDATGELFSAKVDQRIKEGIPQSLTVRYNLTDDDAVIPEVGGALYSSLRPRFRTQNVVMVLSSHVTPSLANNFRMSYGRTTGNFDEVRDPYLAPSVLFPDQPFLLNAPTLVNTTVPGGDVHYVSPLSEKGKQLLSSAGILDLLGVSERYLGALGQVSIAGFSPAGVDVFHFPQRRNQHTFQWADTLTWVSGKHTLHAGFDIIRRRFNTVVERNNRPRLDFHGLRGRVFAGLLPPIAGTEGPVFSPPEQVVAWPVFSALDLVAGAAPAGQFQTLGVTQDFSLGLRKSAVDLFVQDDIRVTPNFRLTLGFRVEFNRLPKDLDDRLAKSFDPNLFAEEVRKAQQACPEFPIFQLRCREIISSVIEQLSRDLGRTFGGDRVGNDPRIAFVWDPAGAGRTAVRGGWGVYTGQFPAIVLTESRSTFPTFSPLNYATTSFVVGGGGSFLYNFASASSQRVREPDSLGAIKRDEPSVPNLLSLVTQDPLVFLDPTLNLVQPSEGFKNPYAYHLSLAIDHNFQDHYWLTLSYVGTLAHKLLRVVTPERGPYRNSIGFRGIQSSRQFPVFQADLLQYRSASSVPTGASVNRTLLEGTANSTYHSLQAELRRYYSGGIQFGVAFTYAHAIDDASDFFETAGSFALPQNSLRRSERGSSNFDVRLRSATHFVWDLPWLAKNKWLGGWQISGIHTAQSGQPFTVNSAIDWNTDGNLTDRLDNTVGLVRGPVDNDRRKRLALAPGVDPVSLLPPNIQREEPANYREGAVGRNTFRSDGIHNLDLALSKRFKITEDKNLQFRAESFNVLNRAHFGIPVRILEAPGFGNSVRTTVPARTVQFGLKLYF